MFEYYDIILLHYVVFSIPLPLVLSPQGVFVADV
jgi:hypothetical protein